MLHKEIHVRDLQIIFVNSITYMFTFKFVLLYARGVGH